MGCILTYEGGHQDHDTTPQEFNVGDDGKPDRRQGVKKAAKTKFFEAKSVNIRGEVFEKGAPRQCDKADVVAKARAMGCFKVEEGDKPEAKPKAAKA